MHITQSLGTGNFFYNFNNSQMKINQKLYLNKKKYIGILGYVENKN